MKLRQRPLRAELLEDRCVPAVFIVDSLGDTGTGEGNSGDLRYVITQANLNPGHDTIRFVVNGTIELESALPEITDSLSILGNGTAVTVIQPSASAVTQFTPFLVNGTHLDLFDLSLLNGDTRITLGASGLAAYNNASVNIDSVEFRNHHTGYAGILSLFESQTEIRNSLFENATHLMSQQRGVVHNLGGQLVVSQSSFINNDMGVGGAIFTEATDDTAAYTSITNVTISNTTNNSRAIVTLAPMGGSAGAWVDVSYSTVVTNTSAVFHLSELGGVNLLGNLFVTNGNPFLDLYDGIDSQGYNVSDSLSFVLNHPTDVMEVDPRLAPLGLYGGSLPIYGLLPESPALNRNPNAPGAGPSSPPAIDARGVVRPQSSGADSGAFEANFRLEIVSGDFQFAQVGGFFDEPLRVQFTYGGQVPIAGQEVTFTVWAGNASFDGSSTFAGVTDTNGFVSSSILSTGTWAGLVGVVAHMGDLNVFFYLYADPGPVAGYIVEIFDGWFGDSLWGEGDFGFFEGPQNEVDPNELFDILLTPIDAFGNFTWPDAGLFTLTSSDPLASFPSIYGFLGEEYYLVIPGIRMGTTGLQTLTVRDNASPSREGVLTLTVRNEAPHSLELDLASINPGTHLVSLSGTFSDPSDPRPHSVLIDWGNGQSSFLTVPAGLGQFQTNFDYGTPSPGVYFIQVSVIDADGATVQRTIPYEVVYFAPQVDAGPDEFLNIGDRLFREIFISGIGPFEVFVDYGDGSGEQLLEPTFGEDEQPRYFLDHIYTRERSFPVTVRVVDLLGGVGEDFFLADVLLPGIDPNNASKVTLTGLEDKFGEVSAPGVTALFFREGREGFSGLIVAPVPLQVADSLNPGAQPPIEVEGGILTVVASYDVRAVNIGPNDYAIVTFSYFNDDLDLPTLRYFDELTNSFVTISPSRYTVDVQARKLTIRLDAQSVPRLQDLFGTVFTISVPLGLPPTLPGLPPGGGGGGGDGSGGGGTGGSVVFTASVAVLLQTSFSAEGIGAGNGLTSGDYNGPGIVDGRAESERSSSTWTLLSSGSEEENAEDGEEGLRVRVRGQGALDDLPAPPEDAITLPGVTLSPAEPRLLDLGPGPTPPVLPSSPSPEESEQSEEEAEAIEDSLSDSDELSEWSPDWVFGNGDEVGALSAYPLLLAPLLRTGPVKENRRNVSRSEAAPC
jgi:hypothetical protein